jgi:hypothetical protein
MGVDMIEEYTPVRLDTKAPHFVSDQAFEEQADGVQTFAPELDSEGGMSAEFIETSSAQGYEYDGNYVLVLDGGCMIDGQSYAQDMLVVTTGVEPQAFEIAASAGGTCLVLAVSF